MLRATALAATLAGCGFADGAPREPVILLTYGQSLAWGQGSYYPISADPDRAETLLTLDENGALVPFAPEKAEHPAHAVAYRIAHEFDAAGRAAPMFLSLEAARRGAALAALATDPAKGFDSVAAGLAATAPGELFYVRGKGDAFLYYANQGGVARGTGKSEPPQLGVLIERLEQAAAALKRKGLTPSDTIYLHFQQGQSDDSGRIGGLAYSAVLSDLVARLSQEASRIFEKPMQVEMFLAQVRGYGGEVAFEQFDAVLRDPHIHFGATEFQYQAEFPAARHALTGAPLDSKDTTHLNAIGHNLIGQQIGRHIYAFMADPAANTDPIAVSGVFVAGRTVTVAFAHVQGRLVDDPSVFTVFTKVGPPEHFGFELRAKGAERPLRIASAAISGRAEVTLELAEPLHGSARLYVGSNEGFNGGTLRDSATSPADIYPGETLVDGKEIADYVPRQWAEIDADGMRTTEALHARGIEPAIVAGGAENDALSTAGPMSVILGRAGDDRILFAGGDSVIDGGEGTDVFVVDGADSVELTDGALGAGVAEIVVVKDGVRTVHHLHAVERVEQDGEIRLGG